MYIRVGLVTIAQMFAHIPVPLRAKAISPSIPNAQNAPGKCRQAKCNQIPFASSSKNPAANVKKGEGSMENEKEDIQESIHGAFVLETFGKIY